VILGAGGALAGANGAHEKKREGILHDALWLEMTGRDLC
jgi:hypothetical protein